MHIHSSGAYCPTLSANWETEGACRQALKFKIPDNKGMLMNSPPQMSNAYLWSFNQLWPGHWAGCMLLKCKCLKLDSPTKAPATPLRGVLIWACGLSHVTSDWVERLSGFQNVISLSKSKPAEQWPGESGLAWEEETSLLLLVLVVAAMWTWSNPFTFKPCFSSLKKEAPVLNAWGMVMDGALTLNTIDSLVIQQWFGDLWSCTNNLRPACHSLAAYCSDALTR